MLFQRRFRIKALLAISVLIAFSLLVVSRDYEYRELQRSLRQNGVEFEFLPYHEQDLTTRILSQIIGMERIVPIIGIRVSSAGYEERSFEPTRLKPFQQVQRLELRGVRIRISSVPAFERLQELRFDACTFEDVNFGPQSASPCLRSLVIEDCLVRSGADFEFGEMSALDAIELSYIRLPQTGLAFLSQFPNLRSINLRGLSCSNNCSLFKPHSGIQNLCISSCDFTIEQVSSLRELTNLQSLEIEYFECKDEDLAFLKELPILRALKLTQVPVNGAFLSYLAERSLMEDIFLYNCPISDYGITLVAKLPDRLKSLSLVYAKLRGNNLLKLKGLANLHTLNLKFTPVQVSLNEFPDSTSLYELSLDCKDMERFDAITLSKFPNLRMLIMTSTGANCVWSSVPELRNLRNLCLDRSVLNTNSFDFVSKLPNLQVLSLNGCQFPNGFIDDLGQLTNLRQLSVQQTKITENEIKHLRGQLPNLTRLIEP